MKLNFSENEVAELIDSDGNRMYFNRFTYKIKTICSFLKCSRKQGEEVLRDLQKEYSVFTCRQDQIVLAKGNRIVYNFELAGETVFNGHEYNELNEWDFMKLVKGLKPRKDKTKINVMCTEIQVKRAMQLYYAISLGFDVTRKDYQRWHLL